VTYTQSGGTVNITTVGNASTSTAGFGLTSAGSVFAMSGGTINLVQASTAGTPLDYQVSGVANVTGGTLNVGTSATATNFSFRIRGYSFCRFEFCQRGGCYHPVSDYHQPNQPV